MKKILTILLLAGLLLPNLQAEDKSETGTDTQKRRPKVGLVLSGGGAKGMAHIGALKVLEELDIPIDYVVGTSIGSIMAGIYALGYSADEMDSLVRSQNWDLLMKDQVRRRDISYSLKEDNDRFIVAIPFMNHKNLAEETAAGTGKGLLRNMPSALVAGHNLDQLFTKLSVGYQDNIDFNTLPIPFACVAVDLNTKEEVVWHSGNIVTAIRSSMSIPGYFAPVQVGNKYLVDGGMLNNLPVDVVKEMGADYVITVDLHHFHKSRPDTDQTLPEMVSTMLSIMNGEKYHSGRNASDILIEPNTSAYGVLSFDERSVDALVDSGLVAARRVLPQLRSLAEHLREFPDGKHLHPAKAVDLSRDSVRIAQLEIQGTEPNEMAWLLSKTNIAPGKFISGEDMDDAMAFFYNTRCFRKVSYSVAGTEDQGYRLKIHFLPQRVHQVGVGFRFDSEEMASILLGLSLNKRKLFGSKLDLDVELGLNSNASIRYGYTFRNLTRLNVSAGLSHMNVDTYDNFRDEARDKERFSLSRNDRYNLFSFQTDYQVTGWRNADINIGVKYDNYLCTTTTTSQNEYDLQLPKSNYREHAWKGFINWKFDSMDDSYFPERGLKTDIGGSIAYAEEGLFYESRLDFRAAIPLGSRMTLIPQTYNRWLFGSPLNYYGNYTGGAVPGRYMPWQLPFIGINHASRALDRVNIARADLRANLFGKHYVTLTGNYMLEWEPGAELQGFLGIGASYAINTIIGPIQILTHWSTLSRSVGFYFSLGYDF